jgi:tyrosine-protein phosphatase YwqE
MFGLFKSSKVKPDLSFIGVDMHSHLLPGLDDGLKTIEDTVAYIKELYAMGYEKLICTPHILSDVHPNNPTTILPKLEEVRQALQAESVPVKIEAAAEYMIDHEFEQSIKRGDKLLTFGTNYILVEMSYLASSPNFDQVIFDLRVQGLQPIIAHPERYNYYHMQFNQYERMKDMGCLLQVNLLSLSGYYGKPIKKVAEKLIEANLISFIGTDMHHQNHLNATKAFVSHKDFYKLTKNMLLKNRMLLD